MASITHIISVTLFSGFILFARPTFSVDSPDYSPSPSPLTPFPPAIPISPPAPSPSDLDPNLRSPSPSQGEGDAAQEKTPYPAPSAAGDVSHVDQSSSGDLETKNGSSGGMSGGKKAGVTVGVIVAVSIVGAGAVVYKKRQQNIQRSLYGYAARREIL